LLADNLYHEDNKFILLKDDFIIQIEIMDDYRQNFEDAIFIFKKFNWSLKEIYSIAYGARQYQLNKIDQYLKTVNNE